MAITPKQIKKRNIKTVDESAVSVEQEVEVTQDTSTGFNVYGVDEELLECSRETRRRAEPEPVFQPTIRGNAMRAWSAGNLKQGRAGEFVTRAKEFLEQSGVDTSTTLIIQPDSELSRELSEAYGFVIYANKIESDLLWHLLVFESQLQPVAIEEVKQRRHTYRDEKVFCYETTADAINDDLVNDITDWLCRNVKVNGDYFFSNVTVVPVEVDLEQPAVIQLLGFDAEDSNLLIADIDTPFSAEMLEDNSNLRANLSFTPLEDKKDLTSLPLRSDIQIAVTEVIREKNRSVIRAAGGSRTLIEVDAYVNARWVGHDEEDRDGVIPPASYIPEVVMTQSNPYHADVYGGNFERFFLGLASLMYTKDGDVWMKGFESSLSTGAKVSSLAYGLDPESFPGGEIPKDIHLVDEDPQDTLAFLRRIFYQSERSRGIPVEFAVLIKEGAVGYASNKLLLDVADGTPGALDKVAQVLDNLTNGVASDYIDLRDESDVIAGQVRVPMGYFKDGDGTHDAEVIDTMFVLSRLKDNYPEQLDNYYECVQVLDREFDHDEAMTKLLDIYRLVTDGQFKLKGFATKLYINPNFLDGLARAIKAKDAMLNMELEANVELNFKRSRRSMGRRASFGLDDSPLGRNRRSFSGSHRRGNRTRYRR